MQNLNLIGPDRLRAKGVPYCRARILQLEKLGLFPRRVRLSATRVAWVEHEIDRWIAARIAERNGGEPAEAA
jgi:prophage regulatory protein